MLKRNGIQLRFSSNGVIGLIVAFCVAVPCGPEALATEYGSSATQSLPVGRVWAPLASDWEQRVREFSPAAELFEKRGIAFDPSDSLDVDFRVRLVDKLSQLPEFSQVRVETQPLKGAIVADTLYLPERVSLEGDTVILVKHLVLREPRQ